MTAAEIIYDMSITFPKLALIAMYLRIFTEKRVRWATWLTGVIVILHFLTGFILFFTICQPFNFKWNKNIKGHYGDLTAVYIFFRIPNILADLCILILPISSLY